MLTFFTSCFGTYQQNPYADFLEHDKKISSKLSRQTNTSTTISSSNKVFLSDNEVRINHDHLIVNSISLIFSENIKFELFFFCWDFFRYWSMHGTRLVLLKQVLPLLSLRTLLISLNLSNFQVLVNMNSPNADGIHVTATQNLRIRDSVIGTGIPTMFFRLFFV